MRLSGPDYAASLAAVPMPDRIRRLPISPKGFPVPWFVAWIDGVPDFRVADQAKMPGAIKYGLCWICGEPLGRHMAMVIGPMCAITRTISEPPAHRDCAIFCAQACPFLSNPAMRRHEAGLPEDRIEAPGAPILRNPGVVAVWITRDVRTVQAEAGNPGVLFEFGDPVEVLWFREGRAATRAEVVASITSGFPVLVEVARQQGRQSLSALTAAAVASEVYLPAAP